MSARRPTQSELRQARKQRRAEQAEQETANGGGAPQIAQGRAQPMLTLDDLPPATDAPDPDGPLTPAEEDRWELCRQGFEQFHNAWWVFARSMDIALRGRLWRRDYETARAFIDDVAGMSTSNVYRQVASAGIAEILAGQPSIEQDSITESRMRDSDPQQAEAPTVPAQSFLGSDTSSATPPPLKISQRAAGALGTIREDYGNEVAADAYRTLAEVTGKDNVSEKTITGIVQQLPRRDVEELDSTQLLDRVRDLATQTPPTSATAATAPAPDPLKEFQQYVTRAKTFATETEGMAAAYTAAAATDSAKATRLAKQLRRHMKHATSNFPNI